MHTTTYLRISASIALFYAIFHIVMPWLVPELYAAPLVNGSGIESMKVFNFLTAVVCLGMAVITFVFGSELVASRLGRVVCVYFASIALFRGLLEIICVGITDPVSLFIIATTVIAGVSYIIAMKKTQSR